MRFFFEKLIVSKDNSNALFQINIQISDIWDT